MQFESDVLPLRPRLYQVMVDVYESTGHARLMNWLEVTRFRVAGPAGDGPRAVASASLGGAVAVPYRWDIRS